ncbi:MAG: DUF2510 domain-containing protein [Actinobacteria bacterium]|nr:DUF2510 domain-containing protein [Actinomycetota bacterium]
MADPKLLDRCIGHVVAPIAGAVRADRAPGARPRVPGWYADDLGLQRFWDGVRWSAPIAAGATPVELPTAPHLVAV